MTPPLPDGTTVRLSGTTQWVDGRRALLGGAPPRLIKLSSTARSILTTDSFTVHEGATARLADALLRNGAAEPDLDSLPAIPLSQVTVVIPAHGRHQALDRLLSGLAGVRTIVVDDASPEPLAEVAARHDAICLRMPVNSGPAAARNQGLAAVETPYVAFCDSDLVVTPDALEQLLKHFHHNAVDLVAPRVIGLPTQRPTWVTRYEAAESSLDLGPDAGVVRPHSRIAWVPGACLVARTEAIAPGFREDLRAGEDVDLVWRLAAGPGLVRYDPAVVVHHEHRTTVRTWLTRKFVYGTSAHDLAQAHGGAVAPAVLTRASALLAAGLISGRPSLTALGTVAQAAHTRQALHQAGLPGSLTPTFVMHGLRDTLRQSTALLLRHWWPIALLARRSRKAAALAMVIDSATEWHRTRPDLDPLRFTLARRLDDLAYGAGVWYAAVRGRSLRCVLPVIRESKSRKPANGPPGVVAALADHDLSHG